MVIMTIISRNLILYVHTHTFYDEPTDHVAFKWTQEYCAHSKLYVHKKIIKIALLVQEFFNFQCVENKNLLTNLF